MKKLEIFSVITSVVLGASLLCAQTEAPADPPTPPSEPFVNQAPEYSTWTIARQTIPGLGNQAADAVLQSGAAAQPESTTTVTKTGPIRHQLRKIKTGEQEDIWYERGSRITMESIWKIPMFEGNTSSPNMPQGPDFPELNWISAKSFVGTQQYQNVVYFVFESKVSQILAVQSSAVGLKIVPTFNRVYINADTRLPLLLQTGDVLFRYAFHTAPTEMLVVPSEYQAMFDAYDKKKKDALRKPAAP